MLEDLLKEHADHIESSDTKEAFNFLTEHALQLTGYKCGPQQKGFIQGFRTRKSFFLMA